jgi:hyperosmotically inducible protein
MWSREEFFMKTQLTRVGTLFFAVLIAIAGFAFVAPNARAATTKSPDVSPVAGQVQHKLAMLPWYGVFDNLAYQVNGSEVTLSGQVISEHDRTKYDAESDVKRIPGVTKVINNIQVLPPSPFDNQIRRAEYRAIFSKSDLGRYTMGAIPPLHIIVNGGHVTLEGVVMNEMDRTVAGISANQVPGVFSVTNNLRVE